MCKLFLAHFSRLRETPSKGRVEALLVPPWMVELDEAYAALGQSPGQQAIGGVRAGILRVAALQVGQVCQGDCTESHADTLQYVAATQADTARATSAFVFQ